MAAVLGLGQRELSAEDYGTVPAQVSHSEAIFEFMRLYQPSKE